MSNVRCKRCQQVNKSNEWLCSCREKWPKCEVHRRQLPTRFMITRTSRKTKIIRRFGTDRPLPRVRTMPGGNEQARSEATSCQGFVGATKHERKTTSPQLGSCSVCRNPKKRQVENMMDAKGTGVSSFPNQVEFLVILVESHKRQLNAIYLDSPPHKMARVNLNPESKLGQRFLHLVKWFFLPARRPPRSPRRDAARFLSRRKEVSPANVRTVASRHNGNC